MTTILKMNNKILIIFLLFHSIVSFGQSRIHFEAKVIVVNPFDTLNLKVAAFSFLLHPDVIDEASFINGVRYLDKGENKGISSSRILSMEFNDTSRFIQKRKFVNSRLVYKKINIESRPSQKYSTLIEEITTGHLSWYIEYISNLYGGGAGKRYLFIKDGELNKGIAFRSFRKSLMVLMSDNPELVAKLKKTKFSKNSKEFQRQALNFINQYNRSKIK